MNITKAIHPLRLLTFLLQNKIIWKWILIAEDLPNNLELTTEDLFIEWNEQ